MKAITILQSVLYTNETENMGIAEYREGDDSKAEEFLSNYFGVSSMRQVEGQFSKGTWLYSYDDTGSCFSGELSWSDEAERRQRGENLAPDVVITIDSDTHIFLYKIEEEEEAKEQERLTLEAVKFKNGESISGDDVVDLCRRYGINVHLRTVHNLQQVVTEINGKKGRCSYHQYGKRSPKLDGCFKTAEQLYNYLQTHEAA